MKIKRLKITSFRRIGDLTLLFDENQPTVLLGINGVGKSSILDCLAILLSKFTGRLQDSLDYTRSLSEQDITNGSEKTEIEITVSFDEGQDVYLVSE